MRFLIDTNILIDYSRNRPDAVAFLRGFDRKPYISAVTIAELYCGVRDGHERRALDKSRSAFDIIPVDDFIAEQAGLIYRAYAKSHGIGLADAIIAASCEVVSARLATRNTKHFPMMSNVLVPY